MRIADLNTSPYQHCVFSALELHLADGAAAAVISQLSTCVSIFKMDISIFKLHSYSFLRVSKVHRVRISSISKVSRFCGSINTINVIAKHYMIEM